MQRALKKQTRKQKTKHIAQHKPLKQRQQLRLRRTQTPRKLMCSRQARLREHQARPKGHVRRLKRKNENAKQEHLDLEGPINHVP